MSKIGILGGSFNPIHNGHIYIAKEVKKQLSLDKVIFVPTGIAPHKDNSNFVSKEHRYNMVRLAVEDCFEVSDIEIKTDKVCYAVDTMAELDKLYPEDKLYYIIGADSLRDFMTWREPVKLFEMLSIVVVDRDGTDIEMIADGYRQKYGADITICHIEPVDISSTKIRNNLKKYGNSGSLIPEKAEKYILEHGLYTED